MMPTKDSNNTAAPRADRRAPFLRFGLILVVLAPLVLVELVLRLCVPAPAVEPADSHVSFGGLESLFILDPAGARFKTNEERLLAFRPQSFAAAKGPNTFRVFCLGGSTVQGRPYSVETSFTTWLALCLRAAQPETDYEVVNCGGISYASYRLVPILRELLDYQPDLFIICSGHNEFLEDRTYDQLKHTPRTLIKLHRVMLHWRSYALANHYLTRSGASSSKTSLSPDVQTKLDLDEGLESYQRDDTWRSQIVGDYRRNIETMVQTARQAGVPVILVNPAFNLKDCPPFKSESLAGLSGAQRQRVRELRERARAVDWSNAYGKIALLEQAVAIDDRDAGLLYLLGMCYERLGRFDEARRWFIRAKEEDICPLRILESMREVVREVADRHSVPLVDSQTLFEARTVDDILGGQWLLDHVHPRIEGHQLIANALFRPVEQMGLVRSDAGWPAARDDLWRRHLELLNDAYYAQGAARLQRLRQWSRGRIPKQ